MEIDTDKQTVECGCKSGRIRGYCKHIRFYKSLIKDLLRENPGFEREKGGKQMNWKKEIDKSFDRLYEELKKYEWKLKK